MLIPHRVLFALLLPLLLAASQAAAQAPVNDSCAGAVTIGSLPFTHAQNTRLATPHASDPPLACADGGGGKTVWFVYTADSTRFVKFTTEASTPADYDIALGLYTGSCGSLLEKDCVDDIVPGTVRQAMIFYEVQAGVTYYLQVAEWNGGGPSGGVPTGGDLVLNVSVSAPPPLYAGPKSGSVAGGDSIVLSALGSKLEGVSTAAFDRSWAPNPPQVMFPAPPDNPAPLAPEGSNLSTDGSVAGALPSPAAYPVIWKEFKGNTLTGFIPPDPILAVGPSHVLGAVNSAFTVWDKDGTLLETRNLSTWFSNVASPVGFSDPQVLYDHYAGRWIVAGGNFASPFSFLISVSDDSDPLGTWYSWSLPSGLGDSLTGNLPDYPQIGYDSLAIYITTREFGASFLYSRLRILEKTQLYANDAGPVTWKDLWNFGDPAHPWIALDGMRPSIIYGSPGEHYMVNASPYSPGTFFSLWKVLDPVGSPSVTGVNVPVVAYTSAPNANQLGGGVPLETGGSAIRHKAVYRDSSLWMTHSIASGPGGAYSAMRYVRMNPHSATVLEDEALGSDGFWYSYPALMADADRNIVITYTRSGVNEYAGAFVAGHRDSDPPGIVPNIIPLAAGLANYVAVGGGRNRWGDYMGIGLDPLDSLAIWVNTEYAIYGSNWETRIGMVKFTPLPGAAVRSDLDSLHFGSLEVSDTSGTLSFLLANDGEDTLVVSSIDLPDSAFHLVDPPSFPHAMESFRVDTLRVRFIPEVRGFRNDSLVVNSNDTGRPALKIALTGNGFVVQAAESGTMYASSGTLDSGRLRALDPVDASSAVRGLSGYTQLLNVRVHPVTGELMGLATTSSTTAAIYDVVRVNTEFGDAHLVGRIPFNFLKGMAYRDDTLYIARITGGIYRADLPADTAVLVASTGRQLAAIDFNPLTGELWASVRGGTPIDGIYRIAMPSGVPTLVGSTGFGVQTVDIAFDANGNLFGLIGTGNTLNDLILIDTLTGTGSKIGSMGIKTAQGIAFHPDVANFAHSFQLNQKWNLLSLPVQPADPDIDAVFPAAILQSRAFVYDGGYVRRESLETRRGFWMKSASAATHSILGAPDSTDTVGVSVRWNLVATNSFTSPVSGISTDPGGILATGFFAYDDTGYVVADSLVPGAGYWVKSSAPGKILLNVPGNAPASTPKSSARERLQSLSAIRFSDVSGRSQTLRIGPRPDERADASFYELPPVPPEAGFDVRFAGGSMAAFHERGGDGVFPIAVSAADGPLTVRWDVRPEGGARYTLVSAAGAHGPESVRPMDGAGSVTLTRGEAAGLSVVAGSVEVPAEYALGQNYPNPFNPVTTVEYALPRAGRVTLALYNLLGEEVARVIDGHREAGYHRVAVPGFDLASGVYFYRLTSESFTAVRKMMLLR